MKSILKKIFIPFVLMLILDLGLFYTGISQNYGGGLNPHTGLFFISGLLFGPYGALGAVSANMLCDFIRGYSGIEIIISAIFSFGISCLAYKLWYTKFYNESQLIKPKIRDNRYLLKFMLMIISLGLLYVLCLKELLLLSSPHHNELIGYNSYFLNNVNFSFIFGIIGIWISKKIDFVYIPSISKRDLNKKVYRIVLALLIIIPVILALINYFGFENYLIEFVGFASIVILIYCYITKPNKSEIVEFNHSSITEKIIDIFLLVMLLIMIFSVYISNVSYLPYFIFSDLPFFDDPTLLALASIDIILIFFFIPSFIVLRYIDKNVVKPIVSFSRIRDFIRPGEKIEAEGLIDVYSNYDDDDTEIGILARSYTDLINYNNNYIENIHEIEGEKERIKTELDIAKRIQQANVPTKAIKNEFFIVNGYSHAAKEVGGDFFDYYQLDEDNIVMVIGDASGKGVPAALLATTTQSIIKQLLNHDLNPSNILYSLNNQLCEHNLEVMFITLWLGIYNKSTNILTFSNAGHNPPLLKRNGKFDYLAVDSGLMLGVVEDFEFKKEEISLEEEIVIYTDGITDANNDNNEMYGEENLKRFFNNFKSDKDPIKPLLEEIGKFVGDCEQFDDMTLMYLKVKND